MAYLCVLVSFKFEADRLLDRLGGIKKGSLTGLTIYDGVLGRVPIRVIKTGMGETHIDPLFFSDCSIVVSTGVCGALTDKLRTGDVVIADEVISVPGEQLENVIAGKVQDYSLCRASLLRLKSHRFDLDGLIGAIQVQETCGHFLKVYRGRTITVPRVIGKIEEKRKLGSYFQAIACDMEDFFRAEPFVKSGLPFLSARVVLDELSDYVPPVKGLFIQKPFKTFHLLKKLPVAKRAISILIEKVTLFLLPYYSCFNLIIFLIIFNQLSLKNLKLF
ncbi:MAG: phosphorylase family protein [Spirochaetota bacterium]